MAAHSFLWLNFMPPICLPASATTTMDDFSAVGFCGKRADRNLGTFAC